MLGYPPPLEQTPPEQTPPGADAPPEQTPPGSTPPQEHIPLGQMPPPGSRSPWGRHPLPTGADTPQSRHPPGSRLQDMVNEQPIRILLECILVYNNFDWAPLKCYILGQKPNPSNRVIHCGATKQVNHFFETWCALRPVYTKRQ